MAKPIVEYEKYDYSIVIVTITSLPLDEFLLSGILAKKGYEIEPQKQPKIITAIKQNSKITISIEASKISISSVNLFETLAISDEIDKIIRKECNFDANRFQFVYQIAGQIILGNAGNPIMSMKDNMISKTANEEVSKIFGTPVSPDAIRLTNGDKFGSNYSQIQFQSRIGQENLAYYLDYIVRDTSKKAVDGFIKTSETKILKFLNFIKSK